MKKRIGILLNILILVATLSACSFAVTDSNDDSTVHPSFSALEDMEEITVEGNTVTVALLQDIPLPYRWTVTYQSEYVTLIEIYNQWVVEPENLEKANGKRNFILEYADGQWKLK